MKRLFFCLLCFILLLSLSVVVGADTISLPEGNRFLEAHYGDCKHQYCSYWSNGSSGCVAVFSSPNSKQPEDAVPNGIMYSISWVYEDEWGYIEYDPVSRERSWGDEAAKGWVKMSEMLIEPDGAAFAEEHKDEIVREEREIFIFRKDSPVWYKYPGSGIVAEVEKPSRGGQRRYSSVYTDSAGREWVSNRYNESWLCISDPFNAELEADENYREIELTEAMDAEAFEQLLKEIKAPKKALLAAEIGIAAATAVLLVFLIRKKHKAER